MLIAYDPIGTRTLASKDLVRTVYYFCPLCTESVFLKAGAEKVAHFSHYTDTGCADSQPVKFGVGESVAHMRLKLAVAAALGGEVEVRLDCAGVLRIADVYVAKDRLVYEIQLAPQSAMDFAQRTKDYTASGKVARVAWLTPWKGKPLTVNQHGMHESTQPSLCDTKGASVLMPPRVNENARLYESPSKYSDLNLGKYLRACGVYNFDLRHVDGRKGSMRVMQTRDSDFIRYVPESRWFEKGTGREMHAGGYWAVKKPLETKVVAEIIAETSL